MQYKNLFFSGLLLALSLPLQVLGDHGRISYYEDAPTSSHPGACGKEFLADYYVALNDEQLDGNKSYYCGKCVKVVYNNKYLVGKINDRCPGCPSQGLDISPKMFDHFVGRSNRERVGVFNADWSIVSCDMYGQSGSGNGGSEHKTTTKKTTTTTKKTTTTTTKKTTTTTKKTTTTTTKIVTTTTTHAPSSTSTTQSEIISTETQAIGQETPVNEIIDNGNAADEVANNTPVEIKPAYSNNNKSAPKETKEEKKEEGGNKASYVVPITGAIMVSGAAGIGLLYMKRESRYENLSSQIKSITRSITHRGSSLGRRVTRSFTKRKTTPPTLPTSNVPTEVINVNQPAEVAY